MWVGVNRARSGLCHRREIGITRAEVLWQQGYRIQEIIGYDFSIGAEWVKTQPRDSGIIIAIICLIHYVLRVALCEVSGIHHVWVYDDGSHTQPHQQEGYDYETATQHPNAIRCVTGRWELCPKFSMWKNKYELLQVVKQHICIVQTMNMARVTPAITHRGTAAGAIDTKYVFKLLVVGSWT